VTPVVFQNYDVIKLDNKWRLIPYVDFAFLSGNKIPGQQLANIKHWELVSLRKLRRDRKSHNAR
jgi:hypothetical protein